MKNPHVKKNWKLLIWLKQNESQPETVLMFGYCKTAVAVRLRSELHNILRSELHNILRSEMHNILRSELHNILKSELHNIFVSSLFSLRQ
jgi:hypothetical protein